MSLKEQALNLYKSVFCEDDQEFAREFTKRYFDKCCRYTLRDGKMVGMLYLLECELCVGEDNYPAVYLYAAATHPEYRNLGIMTELINTVLKSEDATVITRPASRELFGFYKKFGFEVCTFKEDLPFKEFDEQTLLNTADYIRRREELLKGSPHINLTDGEFAYSGLRLYGNSEFVAAVDKENGVIKEYIKRGERLPIEAAPFAMWVKGKDIADLKQIYFGIAMD